MYGEKKSWEQVPAENKNAIVATLYSLGNKGVRKPGSPEWKKLGAPKSSNKRR